jgi:hypothetical protein
LSCQFNAPEASPAHGTHHVALFHTPPIESRGAFNHRLGGTWGYTKVYSGQPSRDQRFYAGNRHSKANIPPNTLGLKVDLLAAHSVSLSGAVLITQNLNLGHLAWERICVGYVRLPCRYASPIGTTAVHGPSFPRAGAVSLAACRAIAGTIYPAADRE